VKFDATRRDLYLEYDENRAGLLHLIPRANSSNGTPPTDRLVAGLDPEPMQMDDRVIMIHGPTSGTA
jgi:hypothetical protein